uniref:Peptidase M13 C-terminal domain-containing protein n=1 Tax=Stomoxys calcitrans TaxID=35570 RepID=A0A1I8PSS2_STOCA
MPKYSIAILILSVFATKDPQPVQAADENPTNAESLESARHAKTQEIRKYMNETVDPCDDFFEFACGNWRTHHPASKSTKQTRAFMMAVNVIDSKLPSLLMAENETDTETEIKIKTFYKSCMAAYPVNRSVYNQELTAIANDFFDNPQLLGNETWPEEENFNWLKTVANIYHKYGLKIILGYDIKADINDKDAHTMTLTGHKSEMPDGTHIGIALQRLLRTDGHKSFKLGQEIFGFHQALMKIAAHNEDYTIIEIDELIAKHADEIDLGLYFNISYGSVPHGEIIYNPKHLSSLVKLLNETPRQVVALYLHFHVFIDFLDMWPSRKSDFKMYCANKIKKQFPDVVSFMFYGNYNVQKAEQQVANIWQDIKMSLGLLLESRNLSWFDDETRESALEKWHWVQMMVPSYQDGYLEQLYKDLVFQPQAHYLDNLKALKTYKAARKRALLNQAPPMDQLLSMTTPIYSLVGNSILVPVSMLNTSYFYSPYDPVVLQMARLGFLLGHEILHGFSGSGRQFDRLGQYFGEANDDMEQIYHDRNECLQEQYHNQTYDGSAVPLGDQDENEADIGGILLALLSYHRWREHEKRTQAELDLEILPALNYTTDQLFFIYYGQTWCADTHKSMRSMIIQNDDHAPDELRVYVPLTNFKEFSEAFQCPLGSKMNPVKKCGTY